MWERWWREVEVILGASGQDGVVEASSMWVLGLDPRGALRLSLWRRIRMQPRLEVKWGGSLLRRRLHRQTLVTDEAPPIRVECGFCLSQKMVRKLFFNKFAYWRTYRKCM